MHKLQPQQHHKVGILDKAAAFSITAAQALQSYHGSMKIRCWFLLPLEVDLVVLEEGRGLSVGSYVGNCQFLPHHVLRDEQNGHHHQHDEVDHQ